MSKRPWPYLLTLALITPVLTGANQKTSSAQLKTPAKWQATIPKVAQSAQDWVALLDELQAQQLIYGELAAAHRMLLFFEELSVKDRAYRAIVDIIDSGYLFSTKEYFVSGDLSPQKDPEFINSYSLYKAMINETIGMQKWAKYYFSKVEVEKFPKYFFYEAVKLYAKGDLDAAADKLRLLFKNDTGAAGTALVRKAARMLARIYFQKEKYSESQDIYMNFLLKINPVTSSDWLEAAWNLYYLKQYPEALGMLYNNEGKTKDPIINLEQYVLRALIYKSTCSIGNVDLLLKNFENDFGDTIRGIKTGQTLNGLEKLLLAFHPENQALYRVYISQGELRREQPDIRKISKKLRPLAQYLYKTELAALDRELALNIEAALDRAAKQMLVLFESLRFLSFDVAREKYRPEAIFKKKDESDLLIEDVSDEKFNLRWTQMGDFWRDERLNYKALLENQCFE